MSFDYAALRRENRLDYGRKIDKFGPRLIAQLYNSPMHFVDELLQNAEDALRRRKGGGPATVRFDLSQSGLRVSHFGQPFDHLDIKGICGIDESTKADDLTAIGRFGIGFKSVYAFTDCPEIHSAGESFAIEHFVLPVEIEPKNSDPSETVFWLPFQPGKEGFFGVIEAHLVALNPRTLLFLEHVEEIVWTVEGGDSGGYRRESKIEEENLKTVSLSGGEAPEDWLLFSRPVSWEGRPVGTVDIAFMLNREDAVSSLHNSKLVVSFPTNVAVQVGFLMQGPYRTTPARDNVPPDDPWNRKLVAETSTLLLEALRRLRDRRVLSVEVLKGLPLKRSDFPTGSMFAPIFDAVAVALKEDALLPTVSNTWVSCERAALARGDMATLVSGEGLATLLGNEAPFEWLSEDITENRAPDLWNYLTAPPHSVVVVTARLLLPKIDEAFLEGQSDEWLIRFYGFLKGLPTLLKEPGLIAKPWVRLENGSHVAAYEGERPQAFLPRKAPTDFPTVRSCLCENPDALAFLRTLGIEPPDPVDEVVANVIPKYDGNLDFDPVSYGKDIERIAVALGSDSVGQQKKLVSALSGRKFVVVRDGGGKKYWATASRVYLGTVQIQSLFGDIEDVVIVDDSCEALKGEEARNLLRRCGAAQYLRAEESADVDGLDARYRRSLREATGNAGLSYGERLGDKQIRGLEPLLLKIATLPHDQARKRCETLWDALCDLGPAALWAGYSWVYYGKERHASLPSHIVRLLRRSKWIPDEDGRLLTPAESVFERIKPAWKPNQALQTALGFKPPVIETLAKEAGVEPGLLDLLKKHGLTSESHLLTLLKMTNVVKPDEAANDAPVEAESRASQTSSQEEDASITNPRPIRFPHLGHTPLPTVRQRPSGLKTSTGQRPFISYIATSATEDDEETSPGQTKEERMRIEAAALDLILAIEPHLRRTPEGNPGFDLIGLDEGGRPNRWIEVKAMTGSLDDRGVAMSRRQFLTAQDRGGAFWLYIVERATSEVPNILRIPDPANNARSFVFDTGWREIALATELYVETSETQDVSP